MEVILGMAQRSSCICVAIGYERDGNGEKRGIEEGR
jgi:hypothetical protein